MHNDNTPTIIPPAATLPPSETECAYDELLASIRVTAERSESLAWAVAIELADLDPVCAAELAPRLYEAVKHG